MQVELIESWGTDLTPVNAARVSLGKESDWVVTDPGGVCPFGIDWPEKKELSAKDSKLVHYLADHKHTSCFEHQGATLRLKVPIFIARQIQRHRTFSYNEISRRYVDNPPELFWPDSWRARADNVKQGSSNAVVEKIMCKKFDTELRYDTQESVAVVMDEVVNLYDSMIDSGVAPELARMVLPQSLYTEFYMSGNLRAWSHFLQLRLDGHAQLEVQQVAQQIEALLRPLWPVSMNALMKESDA